MENPAGDGWSAEAHSWGVVTGTLRKAVCRDWLPGARDLPLEDQTPWSRVVVWKEWWERQRGMQSRHEFNEELKYL